jgi:hypothetical protein
VDQDPDPHWFCSAGSGSKRAKIIQRNRAMWRNFLFWSTGCSLLRAEGFACSLDVLLRVLGITKLQFMISTALDPDGKHADSQPWNTDIRLIDIFLSQNKSAPLLVSVSFLFVSYHLPWLPSFLNLISVKSFYLLTGTFVLFSSNMLIVHRLQLIGFIG